MFNEAGHPNVSHTDWEVFRNEFPPFTLSEVVGRRSLPFPKWYVPLARGAAVASDHLLSKAGFAPGAQLPNGWYQIAAGIYEKFFSNSGQKLQVRQCGYQPLWTVELYRRTRNVILPADKLLVFTFGSTPVLTRSHVASAYLADHAYTKKVISLRWVTALPVDNKGAVAFARQRNGVERRANGELRRQRRANAQLRRQARKVKTP
jgi:hypothetical protein